MKGLLEKECAMTGKRLQKGTKMTYNTRDSLVVTHPTTSLAAIDLFIGERTGSRTFQYLWSYVEYRRGCCYYKGPLPPLSQQPIPDLNALLSTTLHMAGWLSSLPSNSSVNGTKSGESGQVGCGDGG